MRQPKINRPRRIRTRRPADRRGAAMVEFAVVANVLFLVIFTCCEFARMNMVRNLTQDAAYFAARQAIVPGATAADAEVEAERLMSSMVGEGYTVNVAELGENSEEVSVTVSVDLDEVAFFTSMFMPSATIESTARMRTERYAGFYQPD
ncbi:MULTISPECIES: TadE/TadG family type IV pilus assembly protein [Crateriforma]|uniref:TadE-like protein n=1 Tax=Crateriforma conspicua TaxID=2527996 RepID=A0A5C6G1N8_9PLAN|nr:MULTISPECIES: TadE/TadG family type IV pilus assembly protein [Crateriforma]TWU67350.1 TadE-like protein [Crateriforma conspicua]